MAEFRNLLGQPPTSSAATISAWQLAVLERLKNVTIPVALAIAGIALAALATIVVIIGEQAARTPIGLAKSNGRIEIERVDIASKYAGRIARIDVKEGDNVVRGQTIALMDDTELRAQLAARIAYMPQGLGRNLYPTLSVAENIDFIGRLFGLERGERGLRMSRLLRATGLDPFPDRPAAKLSGGMRQKLSLCAALIHQPDLLILDEPTTGIDPLSRRQFWNLIGSLRAERPGMTVIVSTACMEEAERFERLIAIDRGRILADGSVADILARSGTSSLEAAYVTLRHRDGNHKRPDAFVMPRRVHHDGPPAIEAHDLTKRFGDFVAVDRVSFSIARGEIFGFLGSNGCGKTTTMKMLTGLLPASDGRAELLGSAIEAHDLSTRLRIGYMSQSLSLY